MLLGHATDFYITYRQTRSLTSTARLGGSKGLELLGQRRGRTGQRHWFKAYFIILLLDRGFG